MVNLPVKAKRIEPFNSSEPSLHYIETFSRPWMKTSHLDACDACVAYCRRHVINGDHGCVKVVFSDEKKFKIAGPVVFLLLFSRYLHGTSPIVNDF